MVMNKKNSKLKLTAFVIIVVMVVCIFTPGALAQELTEVPVTLERSVSESTIFINDTFDVNYSITPEAIDYESITPSQAKEIVLVVDVSSSMTLDVDGNYTNNNSRKRINIAKAAAVNFVNSIAGTGEDVKVSLISYSSLANVILGLTHDLDHVKTAIQNLQTSSGTNIGDGLRRAYYELESGNSEAEKYIVLLSDGEPTKHSVDRYGNYYMAPGIPYTHNSGGYFGGTADINYCFSVVEELINTKDIQTYMIAFSSGSHQNIMASLAESANGEYKEALTENALEYVYDEISQDIVSDLFVPHVQFEEEFPEGLEISSVPENFSVEGQTVTTNLGTIYYNYNEDSAQYEAAPINFTLTLKGAVQGEYVLGADNTSKLSYKDLDGAIKTRYFDEIGVSIITFGTPILEVESVSRSGDVVTVGLKVTLPDYTANAEIRDETGNSVVDNITVDGIYYVNNLSIYQTHIATMWAVSEWGEENESEPVTLFNAIDIN